MTILALECSCRKASLCLWSDHAYALSRSWEAERNHDAHLFPALQEALHHLPSHEPSLILVGSGPGSYGGIRVALAAAAGIALARHARVVAICSWISLSEGHASIISDAKRGGWTLRSPQGKIEVLDTGAVQQLLAEGEEIWSVESASLLEQAGLHISKCGLVPDAHGLIESWLALSPAEQAALAALPTEPIYVRPPHITTPKRKPWEIIR